MRSFLICCILSFTSLCLAAQDITTANGYLSVINEKIRNVNQTYINYLSAVSHGKSARKVEKLREKTLETIFSTRADIMGIVPFRNDKTLRDATVNYLKPVYNVFNEDYHKIVNMEELAEQSYDAMEAYMLAQEKANEKLEEASKQQSQVVKDYAATHNITLIDEKDALGKKMEQAGRAHEYYNKVYLIFFKSNKQEAYLVDAANRNDINAVEQNRNALLNYATEGLKEILKMDGFEGDMSIVEACKNALKFYKDEAENKVSTTTDFLLAVETFQKTKKSFDAIAASKRTKSDIDNYNKAVSEMNEASQKYNKTNTDVNRMRTRVTDDWNNAVKDFMDRHMPYRKWASAMGQRGKRAMGRLLVSAFQ